MEEVISNFCSGQTIIYKSIYNWSHIFFRYHKNNRLKMKEREGSPQIQHKKTGWIGLTWARQIWSQRWPSRPTATTLQIHHCCWQPPWPVVGLARSRAVVAILTVAVLLVWLLITLVIVAAARVPAPTRLWRIGRSRRPPPTRSGVAASSPPSMACHSAHKIVHGGLPVQDQTMMRECSQEK
jgi:hypothetical protein